ncbi:hypothetical protein WT60_26395 [Burkholderia sp. MSMB617WGS]|uniref:HTH luxR-type domain-containing protein n=1 Tax=Burkholderia savannae TaxID=1637837 RepID=A0ABR5T5Q3_9BURK|nr:MULTISPECIES: alpha/beta fold hydrolase [Burkholderia]AOK50350.1 hypothetical protein WT60_26395 [Burkholderia sp. MSMB617WGS]KGS02514.1 bacterial regulatory s, luxR family protein [Burkholderia sp. ABCPW 111]KWZ38563.1 hypothetical protein WS72_27435 [Burkholderia savannae]
MNERTEFPAGPLSSLIGLIYETANDDDLWPHLLQAMADFLSDARVHDALPIPRHETDRMVASWFDGMGNPLPTSATAAERQIFTLLAPHFVRACDMRQRLTDSDGQRCLSESVLDRLPVGIALVARNGAIVHMNRATRSILNGHGGLAIVAGRLESRPRRLLDDALRDAPEHAQTQAAFRLDGGQAALSVLVSRVAREAGTNAHAMVWVASSDAPLVPEAGLSALFDLSAAEARLTQRLVRGMTLEDAAQDLGTSVNTVKTQLKSVFAKIGVRRQPELVQAIWSTPLWLDQTGTAQPWSRLRRPPAAAARSPAQEDGRLRLPDGRWLAWSDSGDPDGLPLILMHGLSCSRHLRHPDDALLREASIRLIIPERPGTGDSDPMPGRRVSDWPADVAALANHLDLTRFAVLGYSAGTPYALATARAMADRVDALFVVGATPPVERFEDIRAYSAHFRMALMVARYTPNLLPPLLQVVIRSIRKDVYGYIESILQSMPEVDRRVFEHAEFRENYARELLAGVRHGTRHFVAETLLNVHGWQIDGERFAMPVELFHGSLDWHISIDAVRRLTARIPGARLHEIADGGHFLIYSHWRDILSSIRQSVARHACADE